MSNNIKPIELNTSTNVARTFTGQSYKIRSEQRIGEQLFGTMNDVITLTCHFTREDPLTGAVVDVDLTGALALRVNIVKERQLGTEIYVQQTVFNDGVFPDNEDLPTGRVTWLVPIVSASLETFLGSDPFVDIFLEITYLDASGYAQTLGNIPFQVRAEGDPGAAGTPPPTFPTYMDAATALATFVQLVDYLSPTVISGGPTTLTPIKGLQVNLVDSGGGAETINLPESSATDAEYAPLVMNIGANNVDVVPDATGTPDTINGILGTQTIVSQYGSLRLFNDPANNNWIAPNFVTPS
jgi:hypothetical protein